MDYFFLLLCLVATVTVVAGKSPCPLQNMSAPVNFTESLNSVEYAYITKTKALLCCAEGYDVINWYRLDGQDWTYLYSELDTIIIQDNGQWLQIMNVRLTDDTIFRCDLVKENVTVMSHSVNVSVNAGCTATKGPMLTKPFPVNHTIQEYGGNITFYCTGDFGCLNTADMPMVMWWAYISNKTWVNDTSLHSISTRYSVRFYTNDTLKSLLGKSLTIADVQEEDIGRIFTCQLFSTQYIHGSSATNVQIFKQDIPERQNLLKLILIIVGGVVGGILLLTLMTCWVKHMYGPRIDLWCYQKCCHKPLKNEDQYEHNVFLYVHDEDQRHAEAVKIYLTNRGYSVFATVDVQGNQQIIPTYEAQSRKSAVIVFLYSRNLKEDPLAPRFFAAFIAEKKRIYGINIDSEDTAYDEANNADDAEEGNLDIDAADSQEPDLEHKTMWKQLCTLNWPKEQDSERKKRNFWCKLERRIPKFTQQRQHAIIDRQGRERESTNSARPLLDEVESPIPSPHSLQFSDVFHQPEVSQHNRLFAGPDEIQHAITNNTDDIQAYYRETADVQGHVNRDIPNFKNANHGDIESNILRPHEEYIGQQNLGQRNTTRHIDPSLDSSYPIPISGFHGNNDIQQGLHAYRINTQNFEHCGKYGYNGSYGYNGNFGDNGNLDYNRGNGNFGINGHNCNYGDNDNYRYNDNYGQNGNLDNLTNNDNYEYNGNFGNFGNSNNYDNVHAAQGHTMDNNTNDINYAGENIDKYAIVRSLSNESSKNTRKPSLTRGDNHALESSGQYSMSSEASSGQEESGETKFSVSLSPPIIENELVHNSTDINTGEQELNQGEITQITQIPRQNNANNLTVKLGSLRIRSDVFTGSLESGYCTSFPLTANSDAPNKNFPLQAQQRHVMDND